MPRRAFAACAALSLGISLMGSVMGAAWAAPVARLGLVTIPDSGTDRLMLGKGASNFNLRGPLRFDTQALEGEAEFQSGATLYGIGPKAGFMLTSRGGLMALPGCIPDSATVTLS